MFDVQTVAFKLPMNMKMAGLIFNDLRIFKFMVPTHVRIWEVFAFHEPERRTPIWREDRTLPKRAGSETGAPHSTRFTDNAGNELCGAFYTTVRRLP